jgi:putative ABC transport system permease protein
MLLRDWRGGELGVLLAALVIAVAVVSGISAFATRLQNSLEQESHRFLAADRVISSSREIPAQFQDRATALGLSSARTLAFPSMVYSGEEDMVLVSVKAASDAYPLRGELLVSEQPFAASYPAAAGVQPGTVWLDSRLFPLLGVAPGDTVTIGEKDFEVVAALRSEPDSASSFSAYGPRVLMHYDDIPATGVVQPGSRVQYRLLLAGDIAELETYVDWLEPQLVSGQRLLDVSNSQLASESCWPASPSPWRRVVSASDIMIMSQF